MSFLPRGISLKRFAKDLKNEISDDNVSNGAAALAYYCFLAIFPAMIFLLTLLPFLPIHNLQQATMDLVNDFLPGDAAKMFTGTITEITTQKSGGLLSIGLLLTLWAASNGMYATMQQLNITYDVKEGRPFWKTRGTALMLTLMFGALIVGALALVIFGGTLEGWVASTIGHSDLVLGVFAVVRWVVIAAAMALAFALTYYFGPDVKQDFKFITPGSVIGVLLLIVASIGFKIYVGHFGKYNVTYGSLGAVIVMMLWLNVMGLVVLLGSEVNSLIEHYSPEGKEKGEKAPGKPDMTPEKSPPKVA